MIFLSRQEPFNILPRQGPSHRLLKHKIMIFRDAVKYFIDNIY